HSCQSKVAPNGRALLSARIRVAECRTRVLDTALCASRRGGGLRGILRGSRSAHNRSRPVTILLDEHGERVQRGEHEPKIAAVVEILHVENFVWRHAKRQDRLDELLDVSLMCTRD